MEKKEKIWLVFIIIIIALIISLPQIYGWLRADDNHLYSGLSYNNSVDKFAYYSFIEQVRAGKLIIENLFSNEPQVGLFMPLWLFIGLFVRLTTISTALAYNIFRFLFIIIFLLVVYKYLICEIIEKWHFRLVALTTLAFSSGFGFFTVVLYLFFGYPRVILSEDLWTADFNTFLALYHSPLFILSQILIIIFFVWLIKYLSKSNWLITILVSLMILLLGFIHPYDLPSVYLVSFIWIIIYLIKKEINFKSLLKYLLTTIISSLSIFYYLWLSNNDLSFSNVTKYLSKSPAIPYNFTTFGIIFIIFLIALPKGLKINNKYVKLLILWALIDWLLLYIPVQYQGRLANGLHIPMILIVSWWASEWWQKYFKKSIKNYLLIFLMVILLFITTFNNYYVEFYIINKKIKNLYISRATDQSFRWLKENLNDQTVILSTAFNGQILPYYTGKHVFIGHNYWTINFDQRLYETENWFFATNNQDHEKLNWLRKNYVDYIYYSTSEKNLGSFNPQDKKFLKLIYKNQDAEIYQIIK